MPKLTDLDINTLCEQARVTPRTVHFYIQQGLLPPAGAPGPGTRYGEGHVSRLKLIRLLQKQHLPLAEIAKRIKGLTDEQVDVLIAETKRRQAENRGSALDYIRGVLAEPGPQVAIARISKPLAARAETGKSFAASLTVPERSQWERFTLADGMELHVRRPLSRIEQRQLEQLMAAARRIFSDAEGEEQS